MKEFIIVALVVLGFAAINIICKLIDIHFSGKKGKFIDYTKNFSVFLLRKCNLVFVLLIIGYAFSIFIRQNKSAYEFVFVTIESILK